MKNMRVSMKLIVSFLIVTLLAVIVGIVGIVGMNLLNKAQSDLYDSNLLAIRAMGDLRELFGNERSDLRNIFLSQDEPARVKSMIDGFTKYDESASNAFASYETTITDKEAEKGYYAAKEAWTGPYAGMKKDMFALIENGRFDEAYATFMGSSAVIAPITNGFSESSAQNDTWASEADKEGDALYSTLTVIMIAVLVVVIAVSMLLAFYISGLISKPMILLTAFMKKAGTEGDLTLSRTDAENISAAARVKDEIGQCIASTESFVNHMVEVENALNTVADGDLTVDLKRLSEKDSMGIAINKMLDNLNQMFSDINSASSQVSVGSDQVASGSQSLAQGSTEQASSVEELSASISEISEKTKQNAGMAGEAAQLSTHIKDNAEKGNERMDHLMQAVSEINDASQNISKVIKVIDDIAFQTNILALNAAVEAARAGQHGKGFAVVADEVRNLAAKSAASAKDTSSLIENSMEKSNLGLTIATETSESLKEIVDGINHSTEIVTKIAQSSDEQAMAISQINIGIDQVSQVIQQNSATAEESAAASEEMSGQAGLLQERIKQFKLRNENASRAPELSAAKSSSRQLDAASGAATDNSYFGKY